MLIFLNKKQQTWVNLSLTLQKDYAYIYMRSFRIFDGLHYETRKGNQTKFGIEPKDRQGYCDRA